MMEINEQNDYRKQIAIEYQEYWTIPDRVYIARMQLFFDFPKERKGKNCFSKKVGLILKFKNYERDKV